MSETHDFTPGARPAGIRMPLGRRGLILAAMAIIGAGLWLNWGWVAAIGAAPLIFAIAPCAVMCGLGLCMMGESKSCSSKSNPAGEPEFTKERTSNRKENPMKTTSPFRVAAAAFAAIAMVTAVSAQESEAPQSDEMMRGQDAMPGDMTGGDMSGMQGMMPMMKMMEQCTEMMAAMTDHMKTAPQTQDDNG